MGLDAFRKDLRNGMTIEEGLKKHNMSLNDIFQQNLKKSKPSNKKHKGSIWKTRSKVPHFAVHKMINGKHHSYGVYRTRQEAEIIRERLHQANWNKEELDKILEETGIQRVKQCEREIEKDTYIYNNGYGHYVISKSLKRNGKRKTVICGTYTTKKEARIIRDEMLKNNWDNSNLDELCKKHNIVRRTHKG